MLNLRYPGQYYDAESGTNYNMFRSYEPAIGRYQQSDPLGLVGGISTYAYTGSNPYMSTDRLGLVNYVVQIGAGAIEGLGVSGAAGIYITPPLWGQNFDIGVYATGGGGGQLAGGNWGVGAVTGNEDNIKGISYTGEGAGGVGDVAVTFDQNYQPIGFTVGPAAELGGAITADNTVAYGLSDFGAWVGGLVSNWSQDQTNQRFQQQAGQNNNCPQ